MIKTKMIPIKGQYRDKHKVIFKGLTHALSPYDVPQYAFVSYNEEKCNLSIEFNYLTPDEPRKHIVLDDEISLEIGKTSGKIYLVNIFCEDKNDLPNVNIIIEEKVDEFIDKIDKDEPQNAVQLMNFDLAKDFLKNEKELYQW